MQLVAEVVALEKEGINLTEVEIQTKDGKIIREKAEKEKVLKVIEEIRETIEIIETEIIPEEIEKKRNV